MHAFISLYVCIHLLYPCHMYLLRFKKKKKKKKIFMHLIDTNMKTYLNIFNIIYHKSLAKIFMQRICY